MKGRVCKCKIYTIEEIECNQEKTKSNRSELTREGKKVREC